MEYTIIDAATGEVKRSGYCPDLLFQYQCGSGELILPGRHRGTDVFWDGEKMVDIPSSPSAYHQWSPAQKAWIDHRTDDQLRNALRAEVDAERDRRLAAPLDYDGSSLDADADSLALMERKLLSIDRYVAAGEEMLPQELVWQTADNQLRSFKSSADYKQWLSGLVVAIYRRDAQTRAWSFDRKSAIEAASSTEDLKSFDINL